MKMFLLKSVILASLMFLSVLFGMQQANIGIQRMKGYEDPKFKSALTLQETGNGDFRASILGVDVTSHDLEKKKQKLEDIKAYNLFSDLGKGISNGISSGINQIIEMIPN
jgi:hypothetical protein